VQKILALAIATFSPLKTSQNERCSQKLFSGSVFLRTVRRTPIPPASAVFYACRGTSAEFLLPKAIAFGNRGFDCILLPLSEGAHRESASSVALFEFGKGTYISVFSAERIPSFALHASRCVHNPAAPMKQPDIAELRGSVSSIRAGISFMRSLERASTTQNRVQQ